MEILGKFIILGLMEAGTVFERLCWLRGKEKRRGFKVYGVQIQLVNELVSWLVLNSKRFKALEWK